jgi:hypothetical protein
MIQYHTWMGRNKKASQAQVSLREKVPVPDPEKGVYG